MLDYETVIKCGSKNHRCDVCMLYQCFRIEAIWCLFILYIYIEKAHVNKKKSKWMD